LVKKEKGGGKGSVLQKKRKEVLFEYKQEGERQKLFVVG